MTPNSLLTRFLLASLLILLTDAARSSAEDRLAVATAIEIELAESVATAPVSGRLFVLTSSSDRREPRFGPNWFSPEPFFGIDLQNWAPGSLQRLDDKADGFPDKLSTLPDGEYSFQALLDLDFYHSHPNDGVGNLYSGVVKVNWHGASGSRDRKAPAVLKLKLDKVIAAGPFPESRWTRQLVIYSPRLSAFHGHEVMQSAAVILPASYDSQPDRRYPLLYVVSGFGGTYQSMAARYRNGPPAVGEGEAEFIRVMLDGQCKWGHHVYADSARNGPRGAALVEELIPEVDRRFRTVAASTARFVGGHSSGGWSSLWLQVNYPDTFGGVWSTAPDPVDFRDYQEVNLYADPPLSLYTNPQGGRRPLARRGTEPMLWYDSFGKMDDGLGRGGQLRSFEAVFSPLADNGEPLRMWDRTTGQVNPTVVRSWQNYDINVLIKRRWPQIQSRLAGKIHITTGELDTFYLEGAVEQLIGTLKELGSDAEVEVLPGKDHGSVITAGLVRRQRQQMSEIFHRYHPQPPAE